jgi:hypothetical protein
MKLNPTMRAAPKPSALAWDSQEDAPAPAPATGHGLPFLLKVLSVRTALSIQVRALF